MESILAGVALFQKGGVIMYVLLLCSIFVISIAVERGLYFARADSGRAFARDFVHFMERGEYAKARAQAEAARGSLADILFATMKRLREGDASFASYMEVQSGIAIARLRKRLYYLSVIVTMAPLLGLLGTISGMISAFSVFNVQSGASSQITGGVGEALVATAMGLCVAIFALAIHAYFTQRIDTIVTDMELCFSLVEGEKEKLAKEGAAQ